MVRALAAAAVFHGVPRLLIEDNAEEEDKGTLEGWTADGERERSGKWQGSNRRADGSEGLTCTQLKPANR